MGRFIVRSNKFFHFRRNYFLFRFLRNREHVKSIHYQNSNWLKMKNQECFSRMSLSRRELMEAFESQMFVIMQEERKLYNLPFLCRSLKYRMLRDNALPFRYKKVLRNKKNVVILHSNSPKKIRHFKLPHLRQKRYTLLIIISERESTDIVAALHGGFP